MNNSTYSTEVYLWEWNWRDLIIDNKINWKSSIFWRKKQSLRIFRYSKTPVASILQRFLFPPVRSSRWSKRRNRIHKKIKSLSYHKSQSLSYYQSTRLTESIPLGNIHFLFLSFPFFFFPNFSLEGIRFPVYRGLIKGRCATRNKVHRDRCFVVGQINWNSRSNLLVSNAKRRGSLILEWRCMNRGMQYIFHLVLILLVRTGSHPSTLRSITHRADDGSRVGWTTVDSAIIYRWSCLFRWIWDRFKTELSKYVAVKDFCEMI